MTPIEHARKYRAAGLSPIPVKADASKSPAYTGWRTFSNELPSVEQVEEWFADGRHGIGIVPGPASGNLVVLDFENKPGKENAYTQWLKRLTPALSADLNKCPVVTTPSGGRHVWVRLAASQEGGKLARYQDGSTKVEIRGEGHQVLAPGCPLSCHKSGQPYVFENRGWLDGDSVVIGEETWLAWLDHAANVNEWSAPDLPAVGPERTAGQSRESAPGTDFNHTGSWEETGIFDAGWNWCRRTDSNRGMVRRPGKSEGVSASLGMVTSKKNGWPLFYCWSTSVPEFVAEQPYSRFAVYTILKHGGNYSEAAKELERIGYGKRMPTVDVHVREQSGQQSQPGEDPRIFRWMSELKFRELNDKWVWDGYLSRGGITMLSALWKSGKSTLLSHLVRAFDGRTTEFAGRAIVPSRVLYVSEEHEELWAERRDNLNIGDHVGMISRPFKGRPSPAEWAVFLGGMVAAVEKHRFDVVIIDTLSKLWPVREENDAGQVEEALMPLWNLTNAGVAMMLVHHSRKSDGNQFTGSRGSGGLPAFCETLMELRREDESDSKNFNRILSGAGRYQETPAKWKIELTGDGYVSHGNPDDLEVKIVNKDSDWKAIADKLVPESSPGMTIDEINQGIKAERGSGVRRKELLKFLSDRVSDGEYECEGVGVEGNPFRFSKVTLDGSPTSTP